jgi:hypothetical protein
MAAIRHQLRMFPKLRKLPSVEGGLGFLSFIPACHCEVRAGRRKLRKEKNQSNPACRNAAEIPLSGPRRWEPSYWGKSCPTKTNSPKATFFILGWIAGRLLHLVREIHSRGHEVASHGYSHNLCTDCSPKDLRTDLIDSKNLLEDIIGDSVYGYRASSFSINRDILKIIEECGYLYDSSFNSFGLHRRYSHLDLSQNGRRGIALQISGTKHQEPLPREIFTK